ncbi:MAG TPA: AIM24 family protein [Thermoanaerobaculia bacterium]|nr:AIM24 family protein [Thermoanaerobaculia bacterium]HUM30596.1 AIM24 family protein [Thermoanaerobaculia bacterium]HXK68876.1 AIM24 family protein [Thermoanaerobaculia bacterium]
MTALYVMEQNNQVGPLTDEAIAAMIREGRLSSATLCWEEGMAGWEPLSTRRPALFRSAGPPRVPAPSAGGSTRFEVLKKDFYQMPKITIHQAQVILESGALHYMTGDITIEAQLPSVGKFIKAKLTKEHAVRPTYTGTGDIFLEPTFGECTILDLKGDEWILDKGAFLAGDAGVAVEAHVNRAVAGLFGGEGFFQTRVVGHGKVLIHSQGPLEKLEMKNDVLKVDGAFAVARTPGLEFTVEKATGKLFSSWTSGEGFVNTFRGTGTVLIAPVPNRFITLLREFGGLHYAISRISRS